ncbi:hypothetical protein [Caballeronia sp. INDeC2]|uniref:hypothetical protein n=1 Tax=Caballeronia sp. INDeC2 TaxID=2921747 RepID=UPI0020298216|nr:hypothetical protein [Caballeronia sp. INDeC2]
MFVSDSISHVLRKRGEAGCASALLLTAFGAMSFVFLAAACPKTSEWMMMIFIAVVVIGSMIVITYMLVVASSESMLLQRADDAPEANIARSQGTKPTCNLCRGSGRRLRLGCMTCKAYCEDDNPK